VALIEQAIRRGRLAHSLLLHGDDPATLAGVAAAIADRLLRGPAPATAFAPDQHPDCFTLRPAGKSRQISADATRTLIGKLQVSPVMAPAKVAILHEVDRMNTAAANVFLKRSIPARKILVRSLCSGHEVVDLFIECP
jgi:DNA polymerase-3 subunit delta'